MEEAIIVPVILGLTEIIKRFGVGDRWVPIVALVIGVGLSLIGGLTIDNAITGLVLGLSACGLWSGTKAIVGK